MLPKILFPSLAIISLSMCKQRTQSPDMHTQQFVQYQLKSDSIGTIDGVTIFDGGYSALTFDESENLLALNDRGPNVDAENFNGKPAKRFPIPNYAPAITRIQLDSMQIHMTRNIAFRTTTGENFIGLPVPANNKKLEIEYALGKNFEAISNTTLGIDSEGLIVSDSFTYVADEYAPSILKFSTDSLIYISRYAPLASNASAKLPKWLLNRKPNLGFEGLAYADGYLYAALQGPLRPHGSDPKTALVRILRINTRTDEVRYFMYTLDSYKRKIGDLAMHPDGRLLILEHGMPRRGTWSAEIYAINLSQVHFATQQEAFPPERFSDAATALSGGVVVTPKSLFLDLPAAGYPIHMTKPEGLAIDEHGNTYIINDNDYGIDSPNSDGKAIATEMKSFLFILKK